MSSDTQIVVQGSPEWLKQRLGDFTSSEIKQLLVSPQKGAKIAVGAMTYILEKVAERYIQKPINQFTSRATEHGSDTENLAFRTTIKRLGIDFRTCGYIKHQKIKRLGGSPDGYNGGEYVLEIKCPLNPVNHLKNLTIKTAEDFKKMHPDYYYQVMLNTFLCGAKYAVFVSFCPEFPKHTNKGFFSITMELDMEAIREIENRVHLAEEWIAENFPDLSKIN